MTDLTPLTALREAIEAATAGDIAGRDAARARYESQADQAAALQRDRPDLVAGVVDPWAALGSVFDVLEAEGPEAAKVAIIEVLNTAFGAP